MGVPAAGPGVGLATPPPAPRKKPEQAEPAVAQEPVSPPRSAAAVTLESLDPLDGTQRLARALFVGGLFAAAVAVLGQRVAGAFGFIRPMLFEDFLSVAVKSFHKICLLFIIFFDHESYVIIIVFLTWFENLRVRYPHYRTCSWFSGNIFSHDIYSF